jgi:predicted permease
MLEHGDAQAAPSTAQEVARVIPVLEAIAPIFIIILCGYVIQRGGLLPVSFLGQANRFVFFFSLPFLIFTGIVRSGLRGFSLAAVLSVVLPSMAVAVVALGLGFILGLRQGRLGTFVQTSFHGNVSYIGLAILVFTLGESGLSQGSVLIGFLILANNVLAIVVLSYSSHRERDVKQALLSVVKNPVIIATFAGMFTVYAGLPVPRVAMKTMCILANIALPMALVIIGASMSLGVIRRFFRLAATVSFLKLMVLPALSVLYCRIGGTGWADMVPGVILLATPTAITSFTLAQEIGGDRDLASNVVTLSTILSPFSFLFWTVALKAL